MLWLSFLFQIYCWVSLEKEVILVWSFVSLCNDDNNICYLLYIPFYSPYLFIYLFFKENIVLMLKIIMWMLMNILRGGVCHMWKMGEMRGIVSVNQFNCIFITLGLIVIKHCCDVSLIDRFIYIYIYIT